MILSELIGVKDGDVISVVGSGGKTSFVYSLSKELERKRVLVSTTTKMFVPATGDFSYIELDKNMLSELISDNKSGTFFIAEKCEDEGKVKSLPLNLLCNLTKQFQVTILESDGAKRKLVKAWKEFEPVIISETTKTVGIINISAIGKEVNDNNIHRLNEFLQLIHGLHKDRITLDHYLRIITDDNGLFGKSNGRRILFINGVDNPELEKVAIKLINMIKRSSFNIDKVIYGSLKENYILNAVDIR